MKGLAKPLVILSAVVLVVGFIIRLSGAEVAVPPGGFMRLATYLAVLGIAISVCLKDGSGA
jgi:hypothetical protein